MNQQPPPYTHIANRFSLHALCVLTLLAACLQAFLCLPPLSSRHPDTHHTNTHCSMLGLVLARNHPPCSPLLILSLSLPFGSALRGSWPPPFSLPPVDSSNGLRVLTLSFQTRFPAGVLSPSSAFHLSAYGLSSPPLPPSTSPIAAQPGKGVPTVGAGGGGGQ